MCALNVDASDQLPLVRLKIKQVGGETAKVEKCPFVRIARVQSLSFPGNTHLELTNEWASFCERTYKHDIAVMKQARSYAEESEEHATHLSKWRTHLTVKQEEVTRATEENRADGGDDEQIEAAGDEHAENLGRIIAQVDEIELRLRNNLRLMFCVFNDQ